MALNPFLQLPERQYVGARYVPKLAEPFQWNETTVYEPLTIVGYMGSSYTSRKMVPAGTTPVEGEYWALTGNLNGSINQLQTQINTLDKNLADLETKHDREMSQVESNVSANTTTITSLSAQVTTNKNDIANIKQELEDINDLIKREVLIITDSYGNYPRDGTPFTTLVKNRLQNKGNFGNIHTLAFSGHCFVPVSSGGTTFQSLFANWVDSNRAIAEKLTDIYVIGGANECPVPGFDKQTIKTAIANFATYARSVCPNATLHLAAGTKKYLKGYEVRNFQVYEAYRDGGSESGWDFNPDVSQVMCWTPYLNPDDRCHPTQEGANVLANAVVAWLHNEGYEDRVVSRTTIPTSINNVNVTVDVHKIGNVKHTSCVLTATETARLASEFTFDGKNTPFNPRAGVGYQCPAFFWDGTKFNTCIMTVAGGLDYECNITLIGYPETISPYIGARLPLMYQPLTAFGS